MSRLILGHMMVANNLATTGRVGSQTASFAQYYSQYVRGRSSDVNHRRPLCNYQNIFSMNSIRNIYTETSLKLDTFDRMRAKKNALFDSGKERYIERITKYVKQDENQSAVREDLINMIGLAENKQHLDLIERMLQSPAMRDDLLGGSWGTVLMRLYYRMNEVDRAYKNIKDTDTFGNYFMQYAAFRCVMSLLFKAGRYEEVIEIYKLSDGKMTPKNAVRQRQLDVLALAACAKMNTPESFSIADGIYTNSIKLDIRHLSSRLESFIIYHAINMNEPAKAMNYLNNNPFLKHLSLKTLALVKLNRYEDVVFLLREAIRSKDRLNFKIVSQDIVGMIREKKDQIEDEDVRREVMDLLLELENNSLLLEWSMESLTFKEIETSEQTDRDRQDTKSSEQSGRTNYREPRPFINSRETDKRSYK